MKKTEKAVNPAYNNPYYNKMHKQGRWITLGAIFVFCAVPFVVCLYYGVMPKLGDLFIACGALCAVFIPTGVAEMFVEVPVMGTSYYVACVTGNLLNLKLPAAINTLKLTGLKQGTEQSDAVVGVAVAVSSLVTLTLLALGVLLMTPLQPFLSSKAVITAAGYVLPALFGCLTLAFVGNNVGGGVIIKKRLLAAIIPLVVCFALFFIVPYYYQVGEGIVMFMCIGLIYFITKKLYKKGIITVELPEEDPFTLGTETLETQEK